jgi:hypothetical protein
MTDVERLEIRLDRLIQPQPPVNVSNLGIQALAVTTTCHENERLERLKQWRRQKELTASLIRKQTLWEDRDR